MSAFFVFIPFFSLSFNSEHVERRQTMSMFTTNGIQTTTPKKKSNNNEKARKKIKRNIIQYNLLQTLNISVCVPFVSTNRMAKCCIFFLLFLLLWLVLMMFLLLQFMCIKLLIENVLAKYGFSILEFDSSLLSSLFFCEFRIQESLYNQLQSIATRMTTPN